MPIAGIPRTMKENVRPADPQHTSIICGDTGGRRGHAHVFQKFGASPTTHEQARSLDFLLKPPGLQKSPQPHWLLARPWGLVLLPRFLPRGCCRVPPEDYSALNCRWTWPYPAPDLLAAMRCGRHGFSAGPRWGQPCLLVQLPVVSRYHLLLPPGHSRGLPPGLYFQQRLPRHPAVLGFRLGGDTCHLRLRVRPTTRRLRQQSRFHIQRHLWVTISSGLGAT